MHLLKDVAGFQSILYPHVYAIWQVDLVGGKWFGSLDALKIQHLSWMLWIIQYVWLKASGLFNNPQVFWQMVTKYGHEVAIDHTNMLQATIICMLTKYYVVWRSGNERWDVPVASCQFISFSPISSGICAKDYASENSTAPCTKDRKIVFSQEIQLYTR